MDDTPTPTPRYRNVIERAESMARIDGYVGVEHLMLAILEDPFAVPTQVLSRFVEPPRVATAIRELMASPEYRQSSQSIQPHDPA